MSAAVRSGDRRRVRRFSGSRLRLQRAEAGELVHPRSHRAGRGRGRIRESHQPVHLGSFCADIGRRPQSIPRSPARKVYGLIWTTTPWTIPANVAIAYHPKFEYVAVEVDGAVYIVALELLKVDGRKARLGSPQNHRRFPRREARRRRLPPSLSRSRFARHPRRSRDARAGHRRGPHRSRPRPGRFRSRA